MIVLHADHACKKVVVPRSEVLLQQLHVIAEHAEDIGMLHLQKARVEVFLVDRPIGAVLL